MLDVALVNYIGAGWCSLAPAYGLDIPPGAITNGKTLLQLMHRQDPAATQDFVEDAVQSIWTDWLGSGMPASVAVSHLEVLPQLIEESPPTPDAIIAAIAITTATNKLGPAAVSAQARRLSSEIVEHARRSDFLQNSGISEGVTFYFLEALYSRLLRSWPISETSSDQLRRYCEDKPWQSAADTVDVAEATDGPTQMDVASETRSQPATSEDPANDHALSDCEPTKEHDAHGGMAADLPTSGAAWAKASVEAARAKRGSSSQLNDLQAAFFTATYNDLIRILGDNALPTDEFASFARSAEQLVSEGDFAQADLALASLEQCIDDVEADEAASLGNLNNWLARCRSWRGKLHELQFDFRRAARHYEVAAKHLPRENYTDRWLYIDRQIQALASQDRFHVDSTALDEAIKICTGFIVVLHDSKQPSCQADAKVRLARVLLAAGERSKQANQLELAIRHLNEAIDLLEQERQEADKSQATVLLADVLNELGLVEKDTAYLEDAVRLYQALLASAKETDLGDAEQAALGQRLGVALARLGDLTNNTELVALSKETLRKALSSFHPNQSATQFSSSFAPRAYVTLGNLLGAEADQSGSKEAGQEAAEAYESATAFNYLDPHYPALRDVGANVTPDQQNVPQEASQHPAPDSKQSHQSDQSADQQVDPAIARTEHHYLAKLRQTLREAHSKQSTQNRKPGPSDKLSA